MSSYDEIETLLNRMQTLNEQLREAYRSLDHQQISRLSNELTRAHDEWKTQTAQWSAENSNQGTGQKSQ